MRPAIVLCNSSIQLAGAVTTVAQAWVGGRTGLLIDATQYGTIALQIQNNSATWIPVGSAIVANQLFVFDAPPGQYRLNNTAGSSLQVTALLVPVPYNL